MSIVFIGSLFSFLLIQVMMEFTNSMPYYGETSEGSSGMACFYNHNNKKNRPVNKFIPGGATISEEESALKTVRCGKLPAATGGLFRLGLLLKEDPKMLK